MESRSTSHSRHRNMKGDQEKEIITYSRNIFFPITNLCRNKCSYCGFREDPDGDFWVMSEEEVIELAREGKRSGCSEALITAGEKPEVHQEMKFKLNEWGFPTTVDYVASLSEKLLDLGLLPHVNLGILDKEEMRKLRRWNASIGLMLECATDLPVHNDSPGKDPKKRFKMIREAGELKIPFTTGIMIGIGERWEDRIKSLKKIKDLQEEYGHIQEIIIQPFIPKNETPMENSEPPANAKISRTVTLAKKMLPDTSIQVPPNLISNLSELLRIGMDDLGGISTVTPDFINPKSPWPKISKLKSKINDIGLDLKERLPIYPRYAKKSEFMSNEVKKVVKELSNEEGLRKR